MRTNHVGQIVYDNTGKTIKELVEQELGVKYANFNYRSRKGKIHVLDYLFISRRTGVSLELLIEGDPQYQDIIKAVEKLIHKVGAKVIIPAPIQHNTPPKNAPIEVHEKVDEEEEAYSPPPFTIKIPQPEEGVLYIGGEPVY